MSSAFVPAENKLEAVVRISNLTGSGPEELGPGSKERKSVLTNLAAGLGLPVDTSLPKPQLGEAIAQHVGASWDSSCYSTGNTITLEGLDRLLEAAESRLHSSGTTVGSPTRPIAGPGDESAAILRVLRPLAQGEWDGRQCVTEMREAEDRNWAQDKWAGWYFEYRAQAELIRQLGGGPLMIGNTSFDYHLDSVWDLKVHSEGGSAEAILNDQGAMRAAIEEGHGLGFIVLSGERRDDDGAFRQWQRDERAAAGKQPRPRRLAADAQDEEEPTPRRVATSTYAFRPTRLEVFHIPDEAAFDEALERGDLKEFRQGRQQSGAARKPKYKLMLDQARRTILVDSLQVGTAYAPTNAQPTRTSAPSRLSGVSEERRTPGQVARIEEPIWLMETREYVRAYYGLGDWTEGALNAQRRARAWTAAQGF